MATPPVFTTGQVLTAAQMNAVGMWLVKTDTITSGSSKEITACFTSDFKNYRIVLSNIVMSTTAAVTMRMGTTSTGTVYCYGGFYVVYGTAGANTEQSSAANQWLIGVVANASTATGGIIELESPQQALTTSFQSFGGDARTAGAGARLFTGFINNSTQYTSFSLVGDGGATFTSCDIAVYGYNKG